MWLKAMDAVYKKRHEEINGSGCKRGVREVREVMEVVC